MYVQKYFKEDAKQAALEMVADIRREFDTILEEIDWMDGNTKARWATVIIDHNSETALPSIQDCMFV